MISGDPRWCFVFATALATAACGTSGSVGTPPADAAAADVVTAADVVAVLDTPVVDVASVDAERPADDVPTIADAPSCGAGELSCGGRCVNPGDDLMHCGRCDSACPRVTNGTAVCQGGRCGFTCATGFVASAGGCAPAPPPRPVAPLSLGDVSRARPTLEWTLPPGLDGAEVELCRDRACMSILERLTATGTRATPTMSLPARSVVFWRLRGRAGSLVATAYGPTWVFRVPARDGAADTSANAHLDVNGDGFDDIVAAAPLASLDGRSRCGVVRIYHGGAAGPSPTPSLVLAGAAAGDAFGWTVESAGDINGDGYGDVLIGAPLADAAPGADAGAVSVYLGSAAGLATTPATVISGDIAGVQRGGTVAAAGDIDRDGYGDIAIGATVITPRSIISTGSVAVYRGSATGLDSGSMQSIGGAGVNDGLGASVASAGDVNGDGYGDLVVGAPLADVGGRTDAGTAMIFLGGSMGLAVTPARVIEGSAFEDRCGLRVAYAGDINADGLSDVAVGSVTASPLGRTNAGRTQVHFGAAMGAPSGVITLEGDASFDRFGQEIVGGDFNGDGLGDLVVATRNTQLPGGLVEVGRAYVYFGNGASLSNTPASTLGGTTRMEQFGGALGAHDVNGDGRTDLIIGAFGAASEAGRVSVFLGGDGGIGTTPARVYEGAAPGEYFGQFLATLGPWRATRGRRA